MPPPGHEPLLRAICETPDDDAPRLVYADWLEEHGDADRAEVIRMHVRLAGAPAPRGLEHRCEELFRQPWPGWVAELPDTAILWAEMAFPWGSYLPLLFDSHDRPARTGDTWEENVPSLGDWHRGFPVTVNIQGHVDPFLSSAHLIAEYVPVRRVRLRGLSGPGCPGLCYSHACRQAGVRKAPRTVREGDVPVRPRGRLPGWLAVRNRVAVRLAESGQDDRPGGRGLRRVAVPRGPGNAPPDPQLVQRCSPRPAPGPVRVPGSLLIHGPLRLAGRFRCQPPAADLRLGRPQPDNQVDHPLAVVPLPVAAARDWIGRWVRVVDRQHVRRGRPHRLVGREHAPRLRLVLRR